MHRLVGNSNHSSCCIAVKIHWFSILQRVHIHPFVYKNLPRCLHHIEERMFCQYKVTVRNCDSLWCYYVAILVKISARVYHT